MLNKYWFWLVLGIFAALNLMDYATVPGGDPFRDGKIRYLFLLSAPLSYVYFKKWLGYAPAMFVCLAIVSFAVHNFMLYATWPLLLILVVMAVAVAGVKLGEETFAKILLWSGGLQTGFALVQLCFGFHFFYQPTDEWAMHIPVGLYGNETVLGPFLLACLCPALWDRRWVLSGVMVVALVASLSSMTIGSLGVVLFLYAWKRLGGGIAAAVAAAGAFALGLLYVLDPTHPMLDWDGRGVIWKYGWKAFQERPLFGHGVGAWAGELLGKYAPMYATELRTMPKQLHCDVLDFLVEYGLVGASLFVYPVLSFLRNFRPTWKHAACVAILVNGLANFPLCLPPIAVVFVTCWTLLTRDDTMGECEMRAGMRSF